MENKNRLLNRTTYKRIKNMDREQLSDYVTKIYLNGYEAGRKAATPDLLLRTFREVLLSIDSIGPARADAIMKKLSDTFALKEKEADDAETRNTARRPEYEADGYADGQLVYDTAYCPECRHEFEEGVNDWGSAYCPDCGQKLDWTPCPEETTEEAQQNERTIDL